MKKSFLLLLGACTAAIVAGVGYSQGQIGGGDPLDTIKKYIVMLMERVDVLDDRVDTHDLEIGGIYSEMERPGKRVAPGLYEVHTRVLWDAGWMVDTTGAGVPEAVYTENPTALYYGLGRTTFLRPLVGHGIPDPVPGAIRKVRLYVNYGHQWMCEGTPTVMLGDVEFELPMISGHFRDMGTHWSNFRELSEYEHLGHCPIYMYLKDYYWDGPHCNPNPGMPRGVVYRIEAHYYDEYL